MIETKNTNNEQAAREAERTIKQYIITRVKETNNKLENTNRTSHRCFISQFQQLHRLLITIDNLSHFINSLNVSLYWNILQIIWDI